MALDTFSAYSTAATALATIFLVGVTAFLVYATIQLTKVTKKMWLAQDKPYLIFYMRFMEMTGRRIPLLYVKNIGKGPALDIRFNVAVNNQHSPQEIIAIAPYEEIQTTAMVPPETHGEVHITEITYRDTNEILYNQPNKDLIY